MRIEINAKWGVPTYQADRRMGEGGISGTGLRRECEGEGVTRRGRGCDAAWERVLRGAGEGVKQRERV